MSGTDLRYLAGEYAASATTASFSTYALGGQLMSFVVDGDELLYASPLATYSPGKAIRGGVPICFPWFADGPDRNLDPSHGFVRATEWELIADSERPNGREVAWRIGPAQVGNAAGREQWPHDFEATCRQTFEGAAASVELEVRNTGPTPIRFEELLHCYLRVTDIGQVAISGLDGARYVDKTRDYAEFTQSGDLAITEFTDRIFDSTANLTLHDADRTVIVEKSNSANTVIWNPFPERIADFADLPGDAWRRFVCIEPGNIGERSIRLEPGERSAFGMRLRSG